MFLKLDRVFLERSIDAYAEELNFTGRYEMTYRHFDVYRVVMAQYSPDVRCTALLPASLRGKLSVGRLYGSDKIDCDARGEGRAKGEGWQRVAKGGAPRSLLPRDTRAR